MKKYTLWEIVEEEQRLEEEKQARNEALKDLVINECLKRKFITEKDQQKNTNRYNRLVKMLDEIILHFYLENEMGFETMTDYQDFLDAREKVISNVLEVIIQKHFHSIIF